MGAVGELFIQLGFKGDTKGLKDFKKKVEGVAESMKNAVEKSKLFASKAGKIFRGVLGLVSIVSTAIKAFGRFSQSLIDSNKELSNLARTSNISYETFSTWNNLGKVMGVDNASQELANLEEKLYNLKMTGEGWEGFAFAGIDPRGLDAEEVMERLRDKVADMDDVAASQMLKKIGIDPKMLHLLKMTRGEFEEYTRTLKKYQLTAEQSAQMQEMNAQLELCKIKFNSLKDKAILAIMPHFVKLMQSLARVAVFLVNVGEGVGNFIAKWRGVFTVFGILVSRIKPVMSIFGKLREFIVGVSKSFGKLITKIPIFGRLFGMIGSGIARVLWPVTALYLLFDDIATYIDGGSSCIGDLCNWFKRLGEAISDIFKGNFAEGFKKIFQSIMDSIEVIQNFVFNIIDLLLGTDLTNFFGDLKDFALKVFYPKLLKGEKMDEDSKKFAPRWLQKFMGVQNPQLPEPITPQMANNVDNSKNIKNSNTKSQNIVVNNTINTNETGRTVADDLAHMQQAMNSYA